MKPRGDHSCPSPFLIDSLMWVAVFGTIARVSPTCPQMCVTQLVLDGGGSYTHSILFRNKAFSFRRYPGQPALPCVVIYLFFFSLPHPLFLSCWARIPGSLSLLGILEILGEEGREGWGVLEAGGREGGGHWEGQRSGQLHLARAARLSPGLRGRVRASARVALSRHHEGPGILAPSRGCHF